MRNRYESNLLNNAVQAEQFLAQVNKPNVKLLLSTFDLMIEEQDGAGIVGKLGDKVAFLRMSDSNAGAIGEGHLKLGAYLWSVQDLGQSIPILLDVKRPFASPFAPETTAVDIQQLLKKSRSWF